MDPNSGRVISALDLEQLRLTRPEEAAKFTVKLNGTEEEIQKISEAVKHSISMREKEARRAKNKAARKARKQGR